MPCPCHRSEPGKVCPLVQSALWTGCVAKAAWRCPLLKLAACVGLAVGLLFLTSGCTTFRAKPVPPTPPPAAAAIVDAQKGKDSVVIAEAAKIDAIAPAARPHTDAQRAAIAAAPAVDVEKLNTDWKAVVADRDATIAKLTAAIKAEQEKTDRYLIIGGYALAAFLGIAAVLSVPAAQYLPWLGPKITIALALSSALTFALIRAYQWTKEHPWVTGIVLLLLFGAAILAYANNYHHKDSSASDSK